MLHYRFDWSDWPALPSLSSEGSCVSFAVACSYGQCYGAKREISITSFCYDHSTNEAATDADGRQESSSYCGS